MSCAAEGDSVRLVQGASRLCEARRLRWSSAFTRSSAPPPPKGGTPTKTSQSLHPPNRARTLGRVKVFTAAAIDSSVPVANRLSVCPHSGRMRMLMVLSSDWHFHFACAADFGESGMELPEHTDALHKEAGATVNFRIMAASPGGSQ